MPVELGNRLFELFGGEENEQLFEQKFGEIPVTFYGESYGNGIISAGNNKKYNHPKEEIFNRLKNANINEKDIYITKYQGTIWLTSDGENIEIQTRKDINLDGSGQIDIMSMINVYSFFRAHNLLVC